MSCSCGAIRLVWAALLCGTAFAQEAHEPRWIETAQGCKFLDPSRQPGAEVTWDGQCVDGYLHGEGTARLTRGPLTVQFIGSFEKGTLPSGKVLYGEAQYNGSLQDNLPHGQGEHRTDSGRLVRGTFERGKPVGTITMEWPGHVKYVGETELFVPHGKGRIEYAGGRVYEGEFAHGQPNGKGVTTWESGTRHEGEYKAGYRSGPGEMHWPDGTHYKGEFLQDNKHGQATERTATGDEYVGQFVNDSRHGPGKYTYADGSVSEGEWKSNELNGKCRMQLASGALHEGQCIRGKLAGRGHYENPAAGKVYDGEFVDGKYHGRGTLVEKGSHTYEGQFVEGHKSGHGKETLVAGDTYEGEFARNRRHGHGVLRGLGLDGKPVVYEGQFRDGLPDGAGVLVTGGGTLSGEFKSNQFYKGSIETAAGRKFEVDPEKGSILEVLPDGSKQDVTEAELANIKI
jgi:hypothetical protein